MFVPTKNLIFAGMKYLSLVRIINVLLIYSSYWLSLAFRRPIVWGLPFSLSFEPTNFCNLQCIECKTGTDSLTRIKRKLKFDEFQKKFEQLSDYLIYIMLYFQGEPFLNKQIFEMIRFAQKKRVYTCISTNAQLIDKQMATEIVSSGLNKLLISLDGASPETYKMYRQGGEFQKVIAAIENLNEAKKELKQNNPKLILQFLVFRFNEHEIDDIKKLAKQLKVNKLEIKTAQIYDFENSDKSNLIPTKTKYSRYIKINNNFQIKKKLKNQCFRLWSTSIITCDSKVLPCCFDKDADFEMGNLNTENFSTIWKSDKYNAFRKQILKNRKQVEICCNCVM